LGHQSPTLSPALPPAKLPPAAQPVARESPQPPVPSEPAAPPPLDRRAGAPEVHDRLPRPRADGTRTRATQPVAAAPRVAPKVGPTPPPDTRAVAAPSAPLTAENDPVALAKRAAARRKYPEALQYAEQAVASGRDQVASHVVLGDVLFLLTRFERAKSEYETALRLDPGNQQAIVRLKQIAEAVRP
jgi:hypothetical protein